MKLLLLLPLLLGLPGPLFAGDSTDGYKLMEEKKLYKKPKGYGEYEDKKKIYAKCQLWKKDHTQSKKWGTRKGRIIKDGMGGNNPFYGGFKFSWMEKAVDYQTADNAFNQCLKTKP